MKKHALELYRLKHAISRAELAEMADTRRETIYRIEMWQLTPSLGLVQRLIDATGGKVRADDFLGDAA